MPRLYLLVCGHVGMVLLLKTVQRSNIAFIAVTRLTFHADTSPASE